jgi:hypothetical protein
VYIQFSPHSVKGALYKPDSGPASHVAVLVIPHLELPLASRNARTVEARFHGSRREPAVRQQQAAVGFEANASRRSSLCSVSRVSRRSCCSGTAGARQRATMKRSLKREPATAKSWFTAYGKGTLSGSKREHDQFVAICQRLRDRAGLSWTRRNQGSTDDRPVPRRVALNRVLVQAKGKERARSRSTAAFIAAPQRPSSSA